MSTLMDSPIVVVTGKLLKLIRSVADKQKPKVKGVATT